MFGLFKRADEAKSEIFRCVICNRRFREEDIDFFKSRQMGKNICIRCVEFIKKGVVQNEIKSI